MLIASCCLQGRLERCAIEARKPLTRAIFHLSINKLSMTIFATAGDCCVSTLGPNIVCKKAERKNRPRLFQLHIGVVIESHSQMHLVIFHYFIAQLHSALSLVYMFISSNHLDCATCTHLARRNKVGKIFHWKDDDDDVVEGKTKRKIEWVCTWLEKKMEKGFRLTRLTHEKLFSCSQSSLVERRKKQAINSQVHF